VLLTERLGGASRGYVRPLDPWLGEMKRLHVRPAYRGYGLGQQLVVTVIHAAREADYRGLWTHWPA